jgi:hypothetical protein
MLLAGATILIVSPFFSLFGLTSFISAKYAIDLFNNARACVECLKEVLSNNDANYHL